MATVGGGSRSVRTEFDLRLKFNRRSQIAKSLLLFFLRFCGSRRAGIDLSKTREILGFDLCRGAGFAPDGIVHFFAMDADLLGGFDSKSYLVASNVDNGDFDVVPDHDRLVALTGQHQH